MPAAGDADRLFRLDARSDARVTALSEEFASDLARILADTRAELTRLVRRLRRDRSGRLLSTAANLADAVRVERLLRDALERAGYGRLVEVAIGALPDMAGFALQGLPASRRSFTAFDLDTLRAYRALKVTELLQVADDVALRVRGLLLRGVLGAQPERVLVADLGELLDTSTRRAQTVYETALSEFVQTVTALKSDGVADEPFLYVGPVDARCRPFCLDRVGKVYSRASIDAMDNGQLPDPFLTRGGWNCRHQWRRVARASDMAPAADTGRIVSPFVARQINQARAAIAARRGRGRRSVAATV